MEWVDCKDKLPSDDKADYLIMVNYFDVTTGFEIANWSNDYNEIDGSYEKGYKGFYNCHSAYGYIAVDNVIAWCKIEPYC